jgi:predicted anti-sigma-YlaC factor YlaD
VIGCAGFDECLRESEATRQVLNPDFARHLALCPACMATFVSYSRAAEMARVAFDPRDDDLAPLPEDRVHAILEAVRGHRGEAAPSFDVA